VHAVRPSRRVEPPTDYCLQITIAPAVTWGRSLISGRLSPAYMEKSTRALPPVFDTPF